MTETQSMSENISILYQFCDIQVHIFLKGGSLMLPWPEKKLKLHT